MVTHGNQKLISPWSVHDARARITTEIESGGVWMTYSKEFVLACRKYNWIYKGTEWEKENMEDQEQMEEDWMKEHPGEKL